LQEAPAQLPTPAAIIVCLDFGDDGYEEASRSGAPGRKRWRAPPPPDHGRRAKPDPKFYAGSGKVAQIVLARRSSTRLRDLQPRLSPAQERNVERNCKGECWTAPS